MADVLTLTPFRGLRFDPTKVGSLATVLAPPYDVISPARRAELATGNPHNIVALTLPDGGENRYVHARETLRSWRSEQVLRADAEPALYVYEQQEPSGHVQRGLLGALRLVDPAQGVVLPHENTMAGPVADRLALGEATEADLEPIFLLYDGGGAASAATIAAMAEQPLTDTTTDDGVAHRLWAIRDRAVLEHVAADLATRRAVIADGHHRFATYLQRQAARREVAGDGPRDGPWDFGLTFLVDASAGGPRVAPIHRILRGLSLQTALDRAGARVISEELADVADWERAIAAVPTENGPAFVLAAAQRAVLIRPRNPTDVQRSVAAGDGADRSAAWRALTVTAAHRWLIADVLGLPDDEETVGYAHDVREAVPPAADDGFLALLLPATPAADVLAVAAHGERMPRKSTLFLPKPASGMVLRAFADQAGLRA